MNRTVPAWVVDDVTSVREEAEPYRDMTPQQRATIMAMACRAAVRLLQSRIDRDRVLRHRDPLPQSTVVAMERLRNREPATVPGGDDA